jgi:hypothetical protein
MGLLKDAKFLLSLREELAAEERRIAERRMALARGAMEEPSELLPIGKGLDCE